MIPKRNWALGPNGSGIRRVYDGVGGITIVADTDMAPERSEEWLGELFDRHHDRLYRLAIRMTSEPEEARDLVQEAFLRAARRPGSIPATDDGAEAWLVRVVVNLCRDRLRRRRVRDEHARREKRRPAGRREENEAAVVAKTTVERALRRLSPRQRAVIVLAELEGLTGPEVARLLGLRPVTVRWHLAKARERLAGILLSRDPSATREENDR